MRWFLNVDNFTIWDRLVVAGFVLNKRNRLTMGRHVEKIEKEFGGMAQANALFVSSGSTANTLLVESHKQLYGNEQTVVVPTTTWSTSINPWIQAGFKIRFCDVNAEDFSLELSRLENILAQTPKAIVFATSLIGLVPDIYALQRICDTYGAELLFDNCENTLGSYDNKSILSFGTNTTSTYFGHQICSIEGGFLFTKNEELYLTAKMIRNHGLTRSLAGPGFEKQEREEWEAKFATVDPQFLFARVGNNFRNTEINAIFGLLDLKRKDEYKWKRRSLYRYFYEQLDHEQFYAPNIEINEACDHVPFCLPIICKDREALPRIKETLKDLDIEYRPIVGGNLLVQPIYKPYDDGVVNQNSRMLHNRGVYVGLHSQVKYSDIRNLCQTINSLSDT